MSVMDDTTQARVRWFHLTPGRLLMAVVFAVVGLLLLSQCFQWLPNAWPAMVAIGLVLITLLLLAIWFGTNLLFRWHRYSLRALLIFVTAIALAMGLAKIAWEFLALPEEGNDSIMSYSPDGMFRCTIAVPPSYFHGGRRPEVVIDKHNTIHPEHWDEVKREPISFERGSSIDWEYDSNRHTTGVSVVEPDVGQTIWRTTLAAKQ